MIMLWKGKQTVNIGSPKKGIMDSGSPISKFYFVFSAPSQNHLRMLLILLEEIIITWTRTWMCCNSTFSVVLFLLYWSIYCNLQCGHIGLMKGIEKFSPKFGCRLGTYAYWWIRQTIRDFIFRNSSVFHLPVTPPSLSLLISSLFLE